MSQLKIMPNNELLHNYMEAAQKWNDLRLIERNKRSYECGYGGGIFTPSKTLLNLDRIATKLLNELERREMSMEYIKAYLMKREDELISKINCKINKKINKNY